MVNNTEESKAHKVFKLIAYLNLNILLISVLFKLVTQLL